MLRLNSARPNLKLELVLGGAPTTTQPQFVASWSDTYFQGSSGGANPGVATGITPVTLVEAPSTGYLRDIDYISVVNKDTDPSIVKIQYKDGADEYLVVSITLPVGSQLCYTHDSGWKVLDKDGNIRSGSTGPSGLPGTAGAPGATGPSGPAGPPIFLLAAGADEGEVGSLGGGGGGSISSGGGGGGGGSLTFTATATTTSGTSFDFNSIPSTVRRITLAFTGLSTNGTDEPVLQLGTSGSFETTGYTGQTNVFNGTSSSTGTWTTAGLVIFNGNAAASERNGHITLHLVDTATNTWSISGVVGDSGNTYMCITAGKKALSGVLTRLRLTTDGGTDTFDGGLAVVCYE